MATERPIRRLAIVNRGEAALRCIRTVKSLRALERGEMRVVALFTEVDREAPFVRHADEAVRLGTRATPLASYLDHDVLLAALRQADADAVWPGWGFVAESPEFVEKVVASGRRFLGPSADTMRRLGDKIAAKLLAERVGVPVTDWSGGVVETAEAAFAAMKRIGGTVVLKASAGGGGRGIRVVDDPAKLPAAFDSATNEAKGAFGDGRLFVERLVEAGRHVEVQILADTHGFVRALGCRDCSVQRRHQKVIEEAPPFGLPEALLAAVQRDAERVVAEVGYVGVGTVEFLIEGDRHYFLEVNPRLQVEHGITEEITGLDLVEQQIRIARGERLAGLSVGNDGFCIEARVCAEDPDAGFLPAPGRIACFDPALGPHVRVDSGVVHGTQVPSAFDSLIAKVMARGATREQARSRLATALRDFDLVIEGGATNKAYLLEILDSEPYREGGVDTRWLDRWNATRSGARPDAAEALAVAAILAYRSGYKAQRRTFFADTSTITAEKIPSPEGREVDLEHQGEQYRLRVFSVGSDRYRVHLDGRVMRAQYGDAGEHAARFVLAGHYRRVTYDVTQTYIRVELEGQVHRFGRQTAGQVRAGTPSMVVSIGVRVGDTVEAGQTLGLLEAMKMEVAFNAPVSGVVHEVRAREGQQVAAGEVLLVIAPNADSVRPAPMARLSLPVQRDRLAVFFAPGEGGTLGAPDLAAAGREPDALRHDGLEAVHDEVERIFLGFDVFAPRIEKILQFLEAPLPEGLSASFLEELSRVRTQLSAFADVEQLFSRARHVEEGGVLGPSNNARMRVYVRRVRSRGAGIAPEFLGLVQTALRHYGVQDLGWSEALERGVLRMFQSRLDVGHRHRLLMAVLRRLSALVAGGVDLSHDEALRSALARIAAMRGEVSNALADTTLEVLDRVYQGPERAREAERLSRRLQSWLGAAEEAGQPSSPPAEVLGDLAVAGPAQFARMERWLREGDRWRQVIALSAYVRRLYAPSAPETHRSELVEGCWVDRSRYADGLVLATSCRMGEVAETTRSLVRLCAGEPVHALELVVLVDDEESAQDLAAEVERALAGALPARRLTLTRLGPERTLGHESWVRDDAGQAIRETLHGMHPEAARRVDLRRYRNFDLERLWAPEGIYCFQARAHEHPEDERIFVLADVRGRPPVESRDAEVFAPIFEHAFQEATRTLRLNLGMRDPRRELHWNRVVMHLAHPFRLEPMMAQQLARKLLTNIRHLGVEKTIVRLKLLSAERSDDAPREIEVVGSDVASSRLELNWRRPRRAPLVPASPYERRVAAARRHGLVYPYELIRMLTHGDEARERAVEQTTDAEARPVLPVGRFEEYELEPNGRSARAVPVSREPGQNKSAIVFGVITTPTERIPEGMKRVLLLSDPTLNMGALAAPECDRVVAAIDLAESLGVPVEWVPVSSGARIAMDSGTENLDATARVVRRIVTFTESGGTIHVIVTGVNVGAQSYWDALATMLMHTRGVLIMTSQASMVLTGRAALAASGSVSAEDEVSIGGHERVMGPNGQAQYFAADLLSAYQLLYRHYEYSYVVPGEAHPRRARTRDPIDRDVRSFPYRATGDAADVGFECVGDVFDEAKNPGRKHPFAMRPLMNAVIDADAGALERWEAHVGAETAIVWDARIGGWPVCLIGIESHNVPRVGYRPLDGPESWNGGTLFPQSSKKVARAINAASGNRPIVLLANLSGFDGSPESMRKLQLEYGAEIARAVVNFRGALLFLVVSRYHGGAYVVFSRELNDGLHALALEGSYASVIGGGPAATVVFPREVRERVAGDPRIQAARARLQNDPGAEERAVFERLRLDVTLEKRAEVAAEYDAVHSVERAQRVGSLDEIIGAREIRPRLVALLDRALEPASASAEAAHARPSAAPRG